MLRGGAPADVDASEEALQMQQQAQLPAAEELQLHKHNGHHLLALQSCCRGTARIETNTTDITSSRFKAVAGALPVSKPQPELVGYGGSEMVRHAGNACSGNEHQMLRL